MNMEYISFHNPDPLCVICFKFALTFCYFAYCKNNFWVIESHLLIIFIPFLRCQASADECIFSDFVFCVFSCINSVFQMQDIFNHWPSLFCKWLSQQHRLHYFFFYLLSSMQHWMYFWLESAGFSSPSGQLLCDGKIF